MRLVFCIFTALYVMLFSTVAWTATLSAGVWRASGSQIWRTSFPMAAGSPTASRGASELYYPQTGMYGTVTYENTLSPTRALKIEAGFLARMQPGIGRDTDWESENAAAKWYYGEFASGGKSMFFNVDWVRKESPRLASFGGYGYRSNSFAMTDGIYYIVNNSVQNPPWQLSGLTSNYTITYQGPHIGWIYTAAPHGKLSPVLSLTYTPFAYVRGQGWWNLRSLDFTHYGPGQMLDASLALRYAPTNGALFALGYRYQRNSLYRGWENTNNDITWDKAANIQQGLFFNVSARF